MPRDEREAGLRHARPVAVEEGQLPDGREHRLVVDELLDAMEGRLPPLRVDLARLLLDEPLDVGIGAVGKGAACGHEGVDARGGVARRPGRRLDDVLQLLLAVVRDERHPLEGTELRANARGLEIVDDRLTEVGVGSITVVVARVEAVGVARLREEPLRARQIVGMNGRRPEKLEGGRDDAAGDLGEPQRLRLVDGRPVDGMVGSQPHTPVGPRRFGVCPLLGEDEPEGAGRIVGLEGEPRRPLQLLGQGAADRVGDVRLAALEHDQPRLLLRHRLEHQPLHARRLAPVALEGLEHQLHARIEGDEPVGPRAHGRPLEAVVADLLHVLLRHDPPRARGRRAVEGHEVGPRLLEAETDPVRIHHVDARDPRLEDPSPRAPVALHRELDVLGRHRVAVVELHPLAQHELVDEVVRGDGPGLRQARGQGVPRHGLHERIVHGVEEHEGRDDPGRLRRVEPRRGEGDVDGPGQLALGGGGDGCDGAQREEQGGE